MTDQPTPPTDAILDKIRQGRMPCDGAWPP